MMERLARRWNIRSINIVRRREQVELLKKEGAVHVLDSSESGFDEQLRVLCQRHEVRVAFDAVGGELTARIASAMPKGSKILVFGALSGENCEMSPFSVIFEGKKWKRILGLPMDQDSRLLEKMRMASGAQKLLGNELATHVQARFPLEKVHRRPSGSTKIIARKGKYF